MTQPTRPASWIDQLLQRYNKGERRLGYDPIGFEQNREPFDPSGYYREVGMFRDISKAATNVEQQRALFQRMKAQEEENARLRELAMRQPDLSGIQIQGSTGRSASLPGGKGLGAPLRNYNITSGYGPRKRPTRGASTNHGGLDMAAPMGTPIYATHDGVVAFSGWGSGYGNNVSINGASGLQTFYGHQSKLAVKTGQKISKGQLIGYVGSTGVSTGPHLHYEVRINGQKVNPIGYL
jgi:murein DD-endopeptidase MepM/ murein hydrolase activator NlpD